MAKLLLFATLFVFVALIANSHQASTMLKVAEPSPNIDCTEDRPVNCGTFCCPENYRYKTGKYIFSFTLSLFLTVFISESIRKRITFFTLLFLTAKPGLPDVEKMTLTLYYV